MVNYNLYETKLHFVHKFAEALQRKGVETLILNTTESKFTKEMFEALLDFKPEVTAAFNALKLEDGKSFCDVLKIPHWAIALDPLLYEVYRVSHPAYIVSAVDRLECEFGKAHNLSNLFFFPHAVERDLNYEEEKPRPYDVVLIGSCYDPFNLKVHWQRELSKDHSNLIEEAYLNSLNEPMKPFWRVLDELLQSKGKQTSEIPYDRMAYYLDNYIRGIDRLELIKSIKDAEVHVFGGTCWRHEKPIVGWNSYLGELPNVVIHPAIPFNESVEIIKQSKISLNSVPSYKSGTHERVLASLASGAVPITSDNAFLREFFVDGEDLIYYRYPDLESINDKVNALLADEDRRRTMARQGRAKVMQHHTWDVRVEALDLVLPDLIQKTAAVFNRN